MPSECDNEVLAGCVGQLRTHVAAAKAKGRIPDDSYTFAPANAPDVLPPAPAMPAEVPGGNAILDINEELISSHTLRAVLRSVVLAREGPVEPTNKRKLVPIAQELAFMQACMEGTASTTLKEYQADRAHFENIINMLIAGWGEADAAHAKFVLELQKRLQQQNQAPPAADVPPMPASTGPRISTYEGAVADLEAVHHSNPARINYHVVKQFADAAEARDERIHADIANLPASVAIALLRPLSNGIMFGDAVTTPQRGNGHVAYREKGTSRAR